MRNQAAPGPICQNCATSEQFCTVTRELDRRKCCELCEHNALAPDIRETR